MRIDVVVPDKTVSINGEGRNCPNLVVPDDWAWAYHWDGEKGEIEPIQHPDLPFHEVEHFDDIERMRFAIDAWDASDPEVTARGV